MNNSKKIITLASLISISVLFLMTLTILARELPLLVDVSELGEEYDSKRVTIFGWARSAEIRRGRMGSDFVKTELGEGENTVTVFSSFSPYNIIDNRIIVQGVYHHEGRFGGLLARHFIVADAIIRDWDDPLSVTSSQGTSE